VNDKGRRLTRAFNSSKSAQHYAATVEYQLKYGNPEEVFREPAAAPPPPAPTFKDATKRWLAVDGPSFKSGTLEDYECILSLHNLPTFANRPLPSITRAEASELIAQSPVIAVAGRISREAGEVRQAEWLTEPELAASCGPSRRESPATIRSF